MGRKNSLPKASPRVQERSLLLLSGARTKSRRRPYLNQTPGTSLVVQWLRLHASPEGGLGSIPGQGTQIPHAAGCGQNNSSNKKQTPKFSRWNSSLELKSTPATLLFFYSLEIYSAGIPPDSGGLGVGQGLVDRTLQLAQKNAGPGGLRCRPGPVSASNGWGPRESTGQCPHLRAPVRETGSPWQLQPRTCQPTEVGKEGPLDRLTGCPPGQGPRDPLRLSKRL